MTWNYPPVSNILMLSTCFHYSFYARRIMINHRKNHFRIILLSIIISVITFSLCCCGIDTKTVAGSAGQLNQTEVTDEEASEEGESPDLQNEDASEESDEVMVWVSKTGKCYHCKPTCSNMRDPWQIPLSRAKKTKRACKTCYK